MRVTLHGEELDFYDDDAIRVHAVSFAIKQLSVIKQSRLRREFERFYAQVYFLHVKAGGVLAYHQGNKDKTMPVEELDMILAFLRAALNEGMPRLTVTNSTLEVPNDNCGDSALGGAGAGHGVVVQPARATEDGGSCSGGSP